MFSENDADTKEQWYVLKSISEADEVLDQSNRRPQLIYKHSNRCGTCMFAKSEIEKSSEEIREHADMHFLDVIRNREVSDYLAEELNIRHESPQAILFKDGKVAWHDSHSAIKSNKILEKLR